MRDLLTKALSIVEPCLAWFIIVTYAILTSYVNTYVMEAGAYVIRPQRARSEVEPTSIEDHAWPEPSPRALQVQVRPASAQGFLGSRTVTTYVPYSA